LKLGRCGGGKSGPLDGVAHSMVDHVNVSTCNVEEVKG
jgi:hypothetical protein